MQGDTDHVASIDPVAGTVKVMFSDAIIASSDNALVLREAGKDAVYYIPFEDIYFEFLERSDTRRETPPKGVASCWNVSAVGDAASDVMWAYEEPSEAFARLRGHGAFSPDKVRIEVFSEPDPEHQVEFPE